MTAGYRAELTALLQWVRIALLFMAIGPPIGGVVLCLLEVAQAFYQPRAGGELFANALYGFPIIIGFSYLLGALPAGIAGIALGYLQVRYGRVPWYLALACGVVVGLISGNVLGLGGLWFLICVVPTLVCWAIMRRWFGSTNKPDHGAAARLPSTGRTAAPLC